MEYKDSNFKIGEETWTAKYKPMVTINGKYVKAARVPSRKEIHLSVKSQNGTNLTTEELTANFQKAILPYVIKWAENKYGKNGVAEALKELKGEL